MKLKSYEDIDRNRELLRDDSWRLTLATFAHYASRDREKWLPYAWLRKVTRVVERELRKGNARIIINVPPRHGKSETFSKWLVSWFLDLWPEKRVISAAYGADLSRDFGRAVRDNFEQNPLMNTRLREDVKAVNSWMTTEGGGMRSVGVGGPVTGKGGDLIIVDDPHKNWEEAQQPKKRKRLIDWFGPTLYTRLEPGGSIIVIQTRWHQNDLTGYLLNEHSDKWLHINLPAIAEGDDWLGRAEGEALCPERFTIEDLEKIRNSIGSHAFAGLYQQRPAPLEGGIIKNHWLRYWTNNLILTGVEAFDKEERYSILPPGEDGNWLQSWDLAFKDTKKGSFVVGQVWRQVGTRRMLMDQYRERTDFPGMLRAVLAMSAKWPQARLKLVEEKADGAALLSVLRGKLSGLVAVQPTGTKEARLSAVSPLFEAGNVELPPTKENPWVHKYVEELTTFPFAEFDDQVDGTSQALERMRDKGIGEGPLVLNLEIGARGSAPPAAGGFTTY